jgi:P-type Cu+ transporter
MDQHAPGRSHHQHHAPAAAPAKPGAQYTCPMHPQIVRDAPGSCPICGMALVPIAGTGPPQCGSRLDAHFTAAVK